MAPVGSHPWHQHSKKQLRCCRWCMLVFNLIFVSTLRIASACVMSTVYKTCGLSRVTVQGTTTSTKGLVLRVVLFLLGDMVDRTQACEPALRHMHS